LAQAIIVPGGLIRDPFLRSTHNSASSPLSLIMVLVVGVTLGVASAAGITLGQACAPSWASMFGRESPQKVRSHRQQEQPLAQAAPRNGFALFGAPRPTGNTGGGREGFRTDDEQNKVVASAGAGAVPEPSAEGALAAGRRRGGRSRSKSTHRYRRNGVCRSGRRRHRRRRSASPAWPVPRNLRAAPSERGRLRAPTPSRPLLAHRRRPSPTGNVNLAACVPSQAPQCCRRTTPATESHPSPRSSCPPSLCCET